MAKQTINPGTAPTGAGGDTFRSGSAKLQANDDELYAQLGATAQGVLPNALPVSKGGTGAATTGAARTNLGLGTAATKNTGVTPSDIPTNLDLGKATSTHSFITYNPGTHGSTLKGLQEGMYYIGSSDATALTDLPAGANSAHLACFSRINPSGDQRLLRLTGVITGIEWMAIKVNSSTWTPWFKAYSTANTTVDSNGFIKAASPIIQLFADRIELNDEAKQQEIVFEKLNIGDYLIKGSTGFSQEGWYIETPKDANGNVLFSVIYTTLESGDISVKTYKKKFDFETVSIVADLDNPVDITENRWIDLRLQELPQPEIEEPESIAPPDFQPTGLAEAVATIMESYNDTEQ